MTMAVAANKMIRVFNMMERLFVASCGLFVKAANSENLATKNEVTFLPIA
jgi:hypothetical protein